MLKASQTVQTQLKNGLGLLGRQVIQAVTHAVLLITLVRAARLGTSTLDHRRNRARLPASGDQALFGFSRGWRTLDQLDNRINIGQRHCLAFQYMAALACLAQRSEEHTSELQSRPHLVCRLLLEKKN